MDDNDKKTISNKENLTEGNIETASKLSEITNDDGSITYISQITEKKVGIGIIPDAQKVEEISWGVSAEDTKYVDAIRAKKELGILFDDKLSTYISVNAFENILKKMDENLDNYFDALSFGIYSYQEIIELKKSIKTITTEKENIIKYFEVYSEQNNKKLDKFAKLNDDIFKSVDRQLEIIKEEEERKKREEEEKRKKNEEDRNKKEEEEKRKKDEEDRIKKEEEDRIKKEEEEKNGAKEIIINKIEEDEKEVEEKINEKPNLIEPKEENKIEEIKNNEIIIEEPKNEEINEENLDKKDNVKLRGKQKKPKTEDSKINIPDVIDAENDDKNAEMIRENNREPDTQEKERGKCGCILF
jgi:hypothetical protein